MPPQLVRVFSLHRQAPHPCPFPAGWVHRPSLSQQAESIVPAFPSRLSPLSHLCALAASLQSQYHHGCWDIFSSAFLLTGPGRTIIGVTGKKESPGTPETMEKERDTDSKPSGATESSSLFFSTKIPGLLWAPWKCPAFLYSLVFLTGSLQAWHWKISGSPGKP